MHRFLGPFEVFKKVGKVAYELKLPPTMEMHDVFHVSLLRPYRRKGGQPPPALLPDGQVEYEVEAILDHNDDVDNERFYHIKWVGYDVPSWETEAFVQKNCKDMIAEYFRKSGKANDRPLRWSKRGKKAAEPPGEAETIHQEPENSHRDAPARDPESNKDTSQHPTSETQNLRRSARIRK